MDTSQPALATDTDGEWSGYDRERTIREVTRFYEFLATFAYSPDIQLPPPSGWSDSNREVFQRLGKSDEVVELLSHLPYLQNNEWHVEYETKAIQYNSSHLRMMLFDHGFGVNRLNINPFHQEIPPHVVSLTAGQNYGFWWLLDTEKGTITNYSMYSGPQPKFSDEEFAGGTTWRQYPTDSVWKFFNDLKQKFRSLEFIPVPYPDGNGGDIWMSGAKSDEDLEALRNIYRGFNWPDLDPSARERMMETLQEWVREWYQRLREKYKESRSR